MSLDPEPSPQQEALRHLIAGEECGAGETFLTIDPRSGEAFERSVHEATPEEIDAALRAAEGARCALRPVSSRRALLEGLVRKLPDAREGIVKAADRETALGRPRLEMEFGRVLAQLTLFAARLAEEGEGPVAREAPLPERRPFPAPRLEKHLVPLGPCVVFAASNFPLMCSVLGVDSVSALAAGCPVVLKATPSQPATSALVAAVVRDTLEELALPQELFALLHGATPRVGLTLVRHPLTRAVAFTGSERAGRALLAASRERANPPVFHAEMGSVNPIFLLPSALAAAAARSQQAAAHVASACLGHGQFCTQPGLAFALAGDEFEAYLEALAGALREVPAAPLLHPALAVSYREALARWDAMPGVECVARGGTATRGLEVAAALYRCDGAIFARHPELSKEVFGPVLLAVDLPDREAVLALARRFEGELTATIWCTRPEELDSWVELVHRLEERVGRLVLNGFPTGIEPSAALQHGGPWPAASDPRFTSIGTDAMRRFQRPLCYQGEWA